MSKSKNEIKNTSALEFIITIAVSFVVAIIVSLILYSIFKQPQMPKNIVRAMPIMLFVTSFSASILSSGIVLIVDDFIKKDK